MGFVCLAAKRCPWGRVFCRGDVEAIMWESEGFMGIKKYNKIAKIARDSNKKNTR